MAIRGYTLEDWRKNAEENYLTTPISVLKYITVLEEAVAEFTADAPETTYKVGEKVEIVKYGHLIWQTQKAEGSMLPVYYEDENMVWYDVSPQMVGQQGVVIKAEITQGKTKYSIGGLTGKSAWYNEEQLKKL